MFYRYVHNTNLSLTSVAEAVVQTIFSRSYGEWHISLRMYRFRVDSTKNVALVR